jgi:hypothetical protein
MHRIFVKCNVSFVASCTWTRQIGSIVESGRGEIFPIFSDRLWDNMYGIILEGKTRSRGIDHPHIELSLSKVYSSRLLQLWAFIGCNIVKFVIIRI